ncbi:SpoIIE family protein phosphatase [candidate division KSB1 bacterium]|nr:SpoIIE family protein phosphatase [candidate division KSB1 bacterium]
MNMILQKKSFVILFSNAMNRKPIHTYLPFMLLFIVFVIDAVNLITKTTIAISAPFRELLIVAACAFLFPRVKNAKWLQDANITNKIKTLFISIIGIYVLFFALSSLTSLIPSIPQHRLAVPEFASWRFLFVATCASILSTLFGLTILLLLRDLIYFRRTRTTQRNFYLLLYIAGIQLFYLNWYHFVKSPVDDVGSGGTFGKVLLVLFIMVAVTNSFRTAWVNFLDKKQKLAWFAWGLLMLPASYAFMGLEQHATILQYSVTLSLFIKQIAIFLSVYWSLAMLSVLVHLPTAGLHDKKQRDISSLHRLSRTINQEFDPDRLAVLITQQSSDVIEANGVWLELKDYVTRNISLASAHYLTAFELEILRTHSGHPLSKMIFESGMPIIINETRNDDRTQFLHMLPRSFGSLIGVPIITKDKIIGVLYAVKLAEFGFDDEQLDMMRAFANQAAIALENARLINESIQKERLQQELQIAHEAQMKLLPKEMPNIVGLDIDAVCVTANEVGGDYFDFFQLSDHQLAIVVGDVSGKGPEAAFYMAEVKGIIESLSLAFKSPKDILIRANHILYKSLESNMYVTLLYAMVDVRKRTLVFARAGHCPLLHIKQQTLEANYLEPGGLGLGLDRGQIFKEMIEEQTIPLSTGDVCILYTDGIVEAQNDVKDEYGEDRFIKLAATTSLASAHAIRTSLVKEIKQFIGKTRQHDDLTLVVFRLT